MEISTYRIQGLTCTPCVSAVTEELSALPTVVTVAEAIAEAGDYQVIGSGDCSSHTSKKLDLCS